MGKAFGSARRWMIAILLLLFFLGYFSLSQVPDYLANKISKKLGTSVQIGDTRFTPWAIGIQKLHIGNPSGYLLPEALSSRSIQIDAFVGEFLKKEIVIDTITIDDVYLGLEFDTATSAQGNWTVLFSSLKKGEQNPRSEKSVLIKKLIIRKINTDVLYRDSRGGVIHLPEIEELEFNNISSTGGFPVDQLMDSVLGQMLKSVFERENIKNMLQDLLNIPQRQLDNFSNPLRSLFNAHFQESFPRTYWTACLAKAERGNSSKEESKIH